MSNYAKWAKEERKRRVGQPLTFVASEKELEYYKGVLTEVAGKTVKVVMLPDWALVYVEITPEEMPKIRNLITRAGERIVKVTDKRIYFQIGE